MKPCMRMIGKYACNSVMPEGQDCNLPLKTGLYNTKGMYYFKTQSVKQCDGAPNSFQSSKSWQLIFVLYLGSGIDIPLKEFNFDATIEAKVLFKAHDETTFACWEVMIEAQCGDDP